MKNIKHVSIFKTLSVVLDAYTSGATLRDAWHYSWKLTNLFNHFMDLGLTYDEIEDLLKKAL